MLKRTANGEGYSVPEVKGFKISTMFKDFIVWGLDKRENLGVGNRSIRKRMSNCYNYMLKFLTEEERLFTSSFPAKSSPQYADAIAKLSILSNDLASRTLKALLEDEKKHGLPLQKRAQDGVASVGDRIATILAKERVSS
jgi:predicted Zn-dependent protease